MASATDARSRQALLLVDIQKDFCPGGALAVNDGDQIVPVVNQLQPLFPLVVATQDWHPPDHASFAANHPGSQAGDVVQVDGRDQILWPIHCVQQSTGAEFVEDLDQTQIEQVFRKGTDPLIDSYSGFFDNGQRRSTGLADYLSCQRIQAVTIVGLATDYCVKYTALDAIRLGFGTAVVTDACRGVDLQPGDISGALAEMSAAGVDLITAYDLRTHRRPWLGQPDDHRGR